MPISHFAPDTDPDVVAAVIAADGCAVIDRLADPDLMARTLEEMAPYVEAVPVGPDDFSGRQTRRAGGLVARSESARSFVSHRGVLDVVDRVLAHATNYQLHLTQIIAIGPGQPAQPIHRDQWAFDFFSFPAGYEVQCNTIWAMDDFTEENGATRVAVGSHRREDRLELSADDTEPAEMAAGSVLLYTGSLYHGGGENRSDHVRRGMNITYNLAWLRQEENQYLTVPPDVAATLDDDLLRLIGYQRGAYALGYVDDLRDPIDVVRGTGSASGFGDLVRP
jgi:ectoine hydroxylase-related dioxygenase (phytanoyl-CoA dioxygenase family)